MSSPLDRYYIRADSAEHCYYQRRGYDDDDDDDDDRYVYNPLAEWYAFAQARRFCCRPTLSLPRAGVDTFASRLSLAPTYRQLFALCNRTRCFPSLWVAFCGF